jgi:hypothetical protein
MYSRIFRIAVFAALTLVLSGCLTVGGKNTPRETYKPKYELKNVSTRGVLPVTVRRVVVLPVFWAGDSHSPFVADLDNILMMSLQRTNAFELVPISRAQMFHLFGRNQFSSVQVLPDDLMSTIRNMYAADAVMFIDLTVNRPYRPLALGFRARIVDLRNMTAVWAADSLFDSSDPAVAGAAMDYATRTTFNPYPVNNTGGILQSPRAFAAFAADTLFATLPPRR